MANRIFGLGSKVFARRTKSFSNAVQFATLLFVIAAAIGYIVLWRDGVDSSRAIAATLLQPAKAALALLLLAFAFPDAFGRSKLQFPLNITQPLLFCFLTYCFKRLEGSDATGYTNLEAPGNGSLLWLDPKFLAIVAGAQIAFLSASIGLGKTKHL